MADDPTFSVNIETQHETPQGTGPTVNHGEFHGHFRDPLSGLGQGPRPSQTSKESETLNSSELNRLEELVQNAMFTRQELFRGFSGTRSDTYEECGWPEEGEVDPEYYWRLYSRHAIARRVVQLMPKESWQQSPLIYEKEEGDEPTPFEAAWDRLGSLCFPSETSFFKQEKGSSIWEYCERADEQCGIGTFGVILLGIDDGLLLQTSVYGTPPDGRPRDITGVTDPTNPNKSTVPEQTPQEARDRVTDAGDPKTFAGKHHDYGSEDDSPTTTGGPTNPGTADFTRSGGTAPQQTKFVPNPSKSRESDAEDMGGDGQTDPRKVSGGDGVNDPRSTVEDIRAGKRPKKQSGKGVGTPNPNNPTTPADELSKDIYGSVIHEQPLSSTMGTDAQYFGTQFTPTSYHGGNPFNPMRSGSNPNKGDGNSDFQQGGGGENAPGSDEDDGLPTKRLLFLRVFPEYLVQVVQYEADIRNPRYGQPLMYLIMLNDPRQPHTGVGLPMVQVRVHWSRVVHVADNLQSSEIFGTPRMQPVLNNLLALEKLYGGSAQMYWQGAFPGLSIETIPQLGGDVAVNPAEVSNVMTEYNARLRRYLLLIGMSAKSLAPQVVDPTPQINVQMEAICICLGCPMRVFKGAERGELASSQDDSDWNGRIAHRQNSYLTPRLIVPLIDRLISLGILPKPNMDAKEQVENLRKKGWVANEMWIPPGPLYHMEDDEGKLVYNALNQPVITRRPAQFLGYVCNRRKPVRNDFSPKDLPTKRPDKPGQVGTGTKPNNGGVSSNLPPQMGGKNRPTQPTNGKNSKVQTKVIAKGGYCVEWPDMDATSKKDKAGIFLQVIQALVAYVGGNVQATMPLMPLMVDILGWTEEQVTAALEQAEKDAADKQAENEDLAEQHGLIPQVPGYEQPPPPPMGGPGGFPPKGIPPSGGQQPPKPAAGQAQPPATKPGSSTKPTGNILNEQVLHREEVRQETPEETRTENGRRNTVADEAVDAVINRETDRETDREVNISTPSHSIPSFQENICHPWYNEQIANSFDQSQPRDAHGRWSKEDEESHDSHSKEMEKHDKTGERLEAKHDKENDLVEKNREKEDKTIDKQRSSEDKDSTKTEKEWVKIDKVRDKEDSEMRKRHDAEENAPDADEHILSRHQKESNAQGIGRRGQDADRDRFEKMVSERDIARHRQDEATNDRRDSEDRERLTRQKKEMADHRSAGDTLESANDEDMKSRYFSRKSEDPKSHRTFYSDKDHVALSRVTNEFNPDQPRGPDGKFTAGGGSSSSIGASVGAAKTVGERLDKGENPDLHKNALTSAKQKVADLKAKLDKVTDVKGLRTIKKGMAFCQGKVKQLQGALESRYGKRQALAIMASGQVLSWGVFIGGAASGVPIILPGSSLWGSIPAAMAAEGYLQAKRAYSKVTGNEFELVENLTPEEQDELLPQDIIEELAQEFRDELEDEWMRYNETNEGEIKESLTGEE